MPSKHGLRKSRRSCSSSSPGRRKAKKQSSSNNGNKRRHRSTSRHGRGRSSSSSRRKSKKLRPKRRSKSPRGAFDATANGEKKIAEASAAKNNGAAPPAAVAKSNARKTAAAVSAIAAECQITEKDAENNANGKEKSAASITDSKIAEKEKPAAGGTDTTTPAKKATLGDLSELQKQLDQDRDQLEMFIVRAKQEHEERRESKEKEEQREREYYKAEIGEPCGPENRFLLEAFLGKGVFSTVYQAKDMGQQGKQFAVKFIRANPMCRRATEKEVKLMRRLRLQASVQDPEGARALLGLGGVEMFEHEGHLAVVLQLMKCDLRTGLRRYGQGLGLPLPYVHAFAKDIFFALRALRSIKVVHTDLKPENLLISLDRMSVRLSDFGSAMDVNQTSKVRTDYLQPRFYRAPEVILGNSYGTQIDIWSTGVTLYELATDRTLFRGESNNGMIHAMLKVCGAFAKPLQAGKFASKHFSETGDFIMKDKGNASTELLPMNNFTKPARSIVQLLEESAVKRQTAEGGSAEPIKHQGSLRQLADLILKCCDIDPEKRIVPKVALTHAFVQKGEKLRKEEGA
jgi:serine/threonine protein kinase